MHEVAVGVDLGKTGIAGTVWPAALVAESNRIDLDGAVWRIDELTFDFHFATASVNACSAVA